MGNFLWEIVKHKIVDTSIQNFLEDNFCNASWIIKRIFEQKFLIHKYFRQIIFPIFVLIDHRYFHTLMNIENSIQF